MIKYVVTKSSKKAGMVDVLIEIGTNSEETTQRLKDVNPNEFLANVEQQMPKLLEEIADIEIALKDKQQALQAAHSLITQLTMIINGKEKKTERFVDKIKSFGKSKK